MTSPRLLVVWMAGFQKVNRRVFAEVVAMGVPVRLVVPDQYGLGDRVITDVEADDAPYDLTPLTPKGAHPRLQTLAGLDEVAREFRPTHVLIDADPASMLARQALNLPGGAPVWALTAENQPAYYGRDLRAALCIRSMSKLAGVGLTFALRKLVERRIEHVFTLSRDGTGVFEARGIPVTQTPLGFDPDLFFPMPEIERQAVRAELGLDQPVIAFFGRLAPEKGLHVLIRALERLEDLPWQLLIDDFTTYGGAYAESLKVELSGGALKDRVVFFEARHEEMPRFMNAADIVVLPSVSTPKWKEQYGRVIQEVMACGRTMVGSTSGAIPEVMGGHGHLFAEGCEQALARLLRRLLTEARFDDPAARDYALAHLSVQRQAEILAGVLRGASSKEGTV
ncbi:glycosyltransferase [Mameliella alba]|uniref:Poly(Glycerol-phosphate) alpha-glucosyltransferase n=1 Tax=Mameliella alba TaxID=561184 RepID=A0A0B3RQM4_9RHOB|nr:glycosyltransferase [Mameliella alba]KHQ50172.1 Poly(Glycerol-phosphate) alpha-glucosyltransferase [Mameliella alba]